VTHLKLLIVLQPSRLTRAPVILDSTILWDCLGISQLGFMSENARIPIRVSLPGRAPPLAQRW
jgi:hypothetical protein